MADLDSLVRVRQHDVDEKRRVLAGLYEGVSRLEGQKRVLLEKLEEERQIAEKMEEPDSGALFARYADGVQKKVSVLDETSRKMEVKIRIAQEALRESFAELKKIEITRENRKKEEERERNRRETIALDEIAIDQYTRSKMDEE